MYLSHPLVQLAAVHIVHKIHNNNKTKQKPAKTSSMESASSVRNYAELEITIARDQDSHTFFRSLEIHSWKRGIPVRLLGTA